MDLNIIPFNELYHIVNQDYSQFKPTDGFNLTNASELAVYPTDDHIWDQSNYLVAPCLSEGETNFNVESGNFSYFNDDEASPSISTYDQSIPSAASSTSSKSITSPPVPSIITVSSPQAEALPPYSLSLSLSSSPPSSTSPTLPQYASSSSSSSSISDETESTTGSDDSMVALKDKETRRDVELLDLFESTIFNRLLEDNFVKISFLDESLSVASGLRQFEYSKYHELARAADVLHSQNKKVALDSTQPVDQFQIAIIHKHTEKLITSLKKLTSFSSLCIDDQISLLKSRFIDLCIVKSLIFIEPETRSLQINGQKVSMERCLMMNNDKFIELILSINPILRTDPIINLLILLICLLNPNAASLQSSFAVRKEYFLTIHLVQKYLEIRGFSVLEANDEIKRLIYNLENFLLLFNAKQKIQHIVKKHLGYTSQLIAEMLDVNGQ